MSTPNPTPTPTLTPIASGLPVQKVFVLRGRPPSEVFIEQYSTSGVNLVDSLVSDGITFGLANECVKPLDISVAQSGLVVFVLDSAVNNGNHKIFKYTLSVAWDLSTISYSGQSFDTEFNPTNQNLAFRPVSMEFDNVGNTMYLLDDSKDILFQYTLGAPYDLTTVTYDSKFLEVNLYPSKTFLPKGIVFGNWGGRVYMLDAYTLRVDQYNLSVLYDLGSAVYEKSIYLQGSSVFSIQPNSDGTRFYVDFGSSFQAFGAVSNWEIDSLYLIEAMKGTIGGVNTGVSMRQADSALVSPTPTPTVTPTVTPTGTPAVTVTPTVTPTGTPAVTVTPTVTPTGTPASTPA
jgi:hypothetical protein